MTTRLPLDLVGETIHFTDLPGQRKQAHVFERDAILAVNTALACRRPLLVKGDPGVGKSQLARAAAEKLGRRFLARYIDARTEARDLQWSLDAVTRLADAQVYKGTGEPGAAASVLDRRKYVMPEPLWWALNWTSAWKQAEQVVGQHTLPEPDAPAGVVLLLDEIDKADPSVPNGLLECLGQQRFFVPGFDGPIEAKGPAPLIVLTTNGDRTLPNAFVRRCVVLHMRVPEGDALIPWLVARGKAHFGEMEDATLIDAAGKLAADRDHAGGPGAGACKPGLAEYIDLLTALADGVGEGLPTPIETLSTFVFRKHRDSGAAP